MSKNKCNFVIIYHYNESPHTSVLVMAFLNVRYVIKKLKLIQKLNDTLKKVFSNDQVELFQ